MQDYSDSGEMTLVHLTPNDTYYFIPHHCVLKPQSTSIKLWVMFNASARVAVHTSLNCLITGPKVQKDIAFFHI